tara:strand:- start:204 stop:1565 length:1362 start_codon:yes stop_codon:yes gene_type:complete
MKFLTRLLIYTSFIFYSCNETSEVGIDELLISQKDKIKVHYAEIPLEVSNVYFDSVRTDDGDLYFGKNNDPVFGDIEAIGYSQFIYQEGLDALIPGESSENYYLPNPSSQLDSAVLYLKFSKAYGGSEFDEQEVTISQIEDTLFSSALYTSNRYTEISPPKGILGFTRFNIVNSVDTFLTIPIKENYGKFILNRIIDGTSEVELLDQLRGLAIIPGEQNNRIIGFDLGHEDSKFVLYFNNPESGNANSPAEDSLQFVFRMNSPLTKHYSYYNIDRSSSELADVDNLNKNEKFNFQDKIFWQSATGIYPILNLENYQNFLDTAENIILNKVEIVIGPIDNITNTTPPSKAIYYIARNNKLDPVGIISNPEENVIMNDNAYYSNESGPSEHIYDSIITFSYKGESTVFFQELAMDNLDAKTLVAFPEFPNTFDKMVIDRNKVYLKVFYTKYKNQN